MYELRHDAMCVVLGSISFVTSQSVQKCRSPMLLWTENQEWHFDAAQDGEAGEDESNSVRSATKIQGVPRMTLMAQGCSWVRGTYDCTVLPVSAPVVGSLRLGDDPATRDSEAASSSSARWKRFHRNR